MSIPVNKISVKKVVGNVRAIVKEMDTGEKKALMRVIGQVSGVVTGDGDNGTWLALKGSFKATNLIKEDGTYIGTKCFLPGVMCELIEHALQDGGEAIEFAVDVYVIEDESSSVGYVYETRPLFDLEQDDVLTRIETKLAGLLTHQPEEALVKEPTESPAKAKAKSKHRAPAQATGQ